MTIGVFDNDRKYLAIRIFKQWMLSWKEAKQKAQLQLFFCGSIESRRECSKNRRSIKFIFPKDPLLQTQGHQQHHRTNSMTGQTSVY